MVNQSYNQLASASLSEAGLCQLLQKYLLKQETNFTKAHWVHGLSSILFGCCK